MKTKLFLLSIFTIIPIGIISILVCLSDNEHNQSNGFTRNFAHTNLKEIHSWDLEGNSWHIAGIANKDIYLGNVKYLNLLLKCSHVKDTPDFVRIHIPQGDSLHFSDASICINDSTFYVIDGNLQHIYKGKIGEWEAALLIKSKITFNTAIPLSTNSFLCRILQHGSGFSLAKISCNSNPPIIAQQLLTKQLDGVFCKDGQLLYDPYNHKVVYTYLYRNEFLVTDSNLNLTLRGHTIDTTYHAHLKLSEPNEQGNITIKSPPIIVNKRSYINNDYLYINAGLKADNEPRENFNKSSVIDIYQLRNGNYISSFYIPNIHDKKLKDFIVVNNEVYVLYDDQLKCFQLIPEHSSLSALHQPAPEKRQSFSHPYHKSP